MGSWKEFWPQKGFGLWVGFGFWGGFQTLGEGIGEGFGSLEGFLGLEVGFSGHAGGGGGVLLGICLLDTVQSIGISQP